MSKLLLEPAELERCLAALNSTTGSAWSIREDKLFKSFVFGDFIEAMGFMTCCALHAEKMNHHPEWCNVYKTVDVHLTTHSSGGITQLDFDLAVQMERAAG